MPVKGRTAIRHKVAGFTMLEALVVIAIIMVISALTAPSIMRTVNNINVRYSARNLSSLMQTARIQAVRRNTFYSIQPMAMPGNVTGYYVDLNKNQTYASGDTVVTMAGATTVTPGGGSGAPNETAFLGSLGFAVAAGTSPVTFNARGLPCIVNGGVCPQAAGTGFVYFISTTGTSAQVSWAAVAVTPSGHAQVWTCDSGGNWAQR
jgi:Tfp pilus assembly protein FimT